MGIVQIQVEMFPDGRMDVPNAAKYLGFTARSLAMMRCYGGGPIFVKRGRIFYFKADLDKWLDDAKTTKTSGNRRAKRGG